ncbi:MAG: rhodanese-like domain-containing protein [Nitrosomonas sp.]|jgi:rhodanese-related sulfurtransferase|uniref:rhodanese-like domain-containing protein n=1 Tax=Nitrosomonas sp. TaxID=42353 RepID=UPI001DD4EC4B|nr:rhodanese-like domain-containing protein [Nitrosomonas sp.]MBX9896161.1 rhodanese-like domain-containing protein [Nitrosomonas sp.]
MELSIFQDHFLLRLENLFFVIAAVVSAILLLIPMITQGGIKEIDAREAVRLINYKDALILDVRDDSEYLAGHIPNAKHVPSQKMPERWVELEKYKDRPIVVIYPGGVRSNNPSLVLKKNGFTQIVNLMGGIDAWKRAGLPMVKR